MSVAVQSQDAVVVGGAPASSAIDWNELVRVYGPQLRGIIANRVPPGEVDDVLQETFVRAFRSRGRVDLTIPLWPWLVTLAVRSCADEWRSRPSVLLTDSSRLPPAEDRLDAVDLQLVVEEVLAGLPERHRRLLRRCAMEDVAPIDIAVSESLSPEAVRSALARARRGFRRRFLDASSAWEASAAIPVVSTSLGWLRSELRRLGHAYVLGPSQVTVLGLAAGVATVVTLALGPNPTVARQPFDTPVVAVRAVQEPNSARSTPRPSLPTLATPGPVSKTPAEPNEAAADKVAPLVEQSDPAPVIVRPPVGDVGVGPDESYVRLRVEWTDPTGSGHSDASAEVKCAQSRLAHEACLVLREAPGTESQS